MNIKLYIVFGLVAVCIIILILYAIIKCVKLYHYKTNIYIQKTYYDMLKIYNTDLEQTYVLIDAIKKETNEERTNYLLDILELRFSSLLDIFQLYFANVIGDEDAINRYLSRLNNILNFLKERKGRTSA